ncbi:MAG TPA: hypothetical protein VJN62_08465, partial [Gemmatimonadales bacterium]|nr:hypothetical protein [Gemmatimonadales bacterium]
MTALYQNPPFFSFQQGARIVILSQRANARAAKDLLFCPPESHSKTKPPVKAMQVSRGFRAPDERVAPLARKASP